MESNLELGGPPGCWAAGPHWQPGAMGVLWLPTRRAAGYGLALLTLAVTPANVYMWQHPELFPKIPPSLLGIRLVVQVLLLACILWSTSRQDDAVATRDGKCEP
ncbi:hypothetical protein [Cupriavidus basilensis]|nr:hypothetical protein [Cupriavidus basilensis]